MSKGCTGMSSFTVARSPKEWRRVLCGGIKLTFLLLSALLGDGVAVSSAEGLPIFDAHIHYSQPDWTVLTPDQVLASVEERLSRGIYKGIGEFHLAVANHAAAPVVKRCAELAVQRQLFLHAHADAITVEKLLELHPQVKILWAHAGMTTSAATVGQLLDRFPTLWVELALRSDVAPDGTLDAEWRAVFLRHPDRFMVGTDTWVTSRWETLVEGMQTIRSWLNELPREVAAQIAHRNAERLFSGP
jgi:predicted TIM-barrel fold metal-dependent hydrolase